MSNTNTLEDLRKIIETTFLRFRLEIESPVTLTFEKSVWNHKDGETDVLLSYHAGKDYKERYIAPSGHIRHISSAWDHYENKMLTALESKLIEYFSTGQATVSIPIAAVPDDTYAINVLLNNDMLPIEDLRSMWSQLSESQREGWFTSVPVRRTVDANDVIDNIIEGLAYDGYEEMDTMLYEHLPKDATKRLQSVLNELFNNTAADVYYPELKIL